jgi:hypothetical protein
VLRSIYADEGSGGGWENEILGVGLVGTVKGSGVSPATPQPEKKEAVMFSLLPEKNEVFAVPGLGSVISQLPSVIKQSTDSTDFPNFHEMGVTPVKSTRTYWWVLALIILGGIVYACLTNKKRY